MLYTNYTSYDVKDAACAVGRGVLMGRHARARSLAAERFGQGAPAIWDIFSLVKHNGYMGAPRALSLCVVYGPDVPSVAH